jgi:predicted DCC family thiol-disulfide oxidoreductase YuxK
LDSLSNLPATTLVFYDGLCGLCDGFVQFLLKRDRHARIAFATLQGELARGMLVPLGYDPGDLDSIFVVADWKAAQQRLLNRSQAVLHAVAQLGGAWRIFATVASIVPVFIADRVYGLVARHRYRVFGRFDTCPLPRPEWKNRFL